MNPDRTDSAMEYDTESLLPKASDVATSTSAPGSVLQVRDEPFACGA